MIRAAVVGSLVLAMLGAATGEWSGPAIVGWFCVCIAVGGWRARHRMTHRPPPPWES